MKQIPSSYLLQFFFFMSIYIDDNDDTRISSEQLSYFDDFDYDCCVQAYFEYITTKDLLLLLKMNPT